MFIHSLYYKDHSTGWTLGAPDEPMVFDRLTLLVGASGVGKTKTLGAILFLRSLVVYGRSWNGVEWDITFVLKTGEKCRWQGKFEKSDYVSYFVLDSLQEGQRPEFNVEYEKLWVNGASIAERNSKGVIFRGNSIQHLILSKSILYLLKEDELVKVIYNDFINIYFVDNAENPNARNISLGKGLDSRILKYDNVQELRESGESIINKMYIAYKVNFDVFEQIKRELINIFPLIENMKVDRMEVEVSVMDKYASSPIFIYIKEKGDEYWQDEIDMSSGMIKTLMHLAYLNLSPDNSLILIDEFENSLGINCIDEVTSSILSQNRNLQFILTSHHPYIINHISSEHWKILTRKGGVVTAHNAKDVGIGKSKHTAFTQLINLDMYNTGMEDQ